MGNKPRVTSNLDQRSASELAVGPALPAWLETVRTQVNSLRYGQVQIVVHDARVVQIERIEKFRFDPKTSAS